MEISYRPTLTREWDPKLPKLGWVMLNPSTADEVEDDPTIRKVRGFTQAWAGRLYHWSERLAPPEGRNAHPEWGGFVVANLYPRRATKPKDLILAPEFERLGDDPNAGFAALAQCEGIVLAWGAQGSRFPGRVWEVCRLMHETKQQLLCLGLTKHRQPMHPLMLGYKTPFSTFLDADPRSVITCKETKPWTST